MCVIKKPLIHELPKKCRDLPGSEGALEVRVTYELRLKKRKRRRSG